VVADLAAVSDVATVSDVIAGAGIKAFGAVGSAVWLVDEDTGTYVHAAASGVGEPRGKLPADAVDRYPALGAGHVVVVSDESASDEDSDLRADLGGAAGSLVLAPLTALGRTLGVIALLMPETRASEPEELSLLQTLGRQAGQALERAQLFDMQRMVATTLQRSMLPQALVDDPRLQVSACYRPAIDGLYVGGDWYDAFRLDDDRVGLVVGDVVGRGLPAAAAMGQLRSAVRAIATTGSGPGRLLEGLDRFVEGVAAADTATLAYAEVDLRDGSTHFACAGHPPPVLVHGPGRAEQLWGGRSAPLGAQFGDTTRPEATITLLPGSRLVLYTDGLVERRDEPLDQSIDEFAAVLGTWADRPFENLAEGVTDALVGSGGTDDDVCLLAVAFRAHPTVR
jgi:serine/threonine-protein kinase RsbW